MERTKYYYNYYFTVVIKLI